MNDSNKYIKKVYSNYDFPKKIFLNKKEYVFVGFKRLSEKEFNRLGVVLDEFYDSGTKRVIYTLEEVL